MELGFYDCLFSSLSDFASIICTFSRCKHLFIKSSCWIWDTPPNFFESFPRHSVVLEELVLESNRVGWSVEGFVTLLDSINLKRLRWLYCDLQRSSVTRAILQTTNQTVEHLQVSNNETGSQVLQNPSPIHEMPRLTNLLISFENHVDVTIFENFASKHCIETVTICFHASFAQELRTIRWEMFDSILPEVPTQSNLIKFDMRIQLRNRHLNKVRREALAKKLPKLVARKALFFWDEKFGL